MHGATLGQTRTKYVVAVTPPHEEFSLVNNIPFQICSILQVEIATGR